MLLKRFALLLMAVLFSSLAAADQSQYSIGPGDMISVSVFGEPDLSVAKVKVGSNGNISIPLIGQVGVKGQTVSQLEARLESLLKAGYMKDPKVTVAILDYRPFYVYGEVRKPGGYPYKDGLTVEKAIALAGGFTPRASKRKVTLKHENDNDSASGGVKVNLKASVTPGDVITVGESFF